MMLEERVGVAGLAEGFEAVYVAADGAERRVPWGWLPDVLDELGRPVRSFPSYKGQRNYPGWYWSATMGRRVGFESWVERDHLVALDIDPAVVGIFSQPFWLTWPGPTGKRRRHAPDFLVQVDDGGVVVLDSRPLELIKDADRDAFATTERACSLVGWRYAVWGRVEGVVVANQRWLAGYRHPRCFRAEVAERLVEVFTLPRLLIDGAELAGDTLETLPVLYHLIWRRVLTADLSLPLGHRTLVRAVPGSAGMVRGGEQDA
jgi:hypothetical protein